MVVAVTNGRLELGPWEQISYGEFDGGRRKRVLVKIIGEWPSTPRELAMRTTPPSLAIARASVTHSR